MRRLLLTISLTLALLAITSPSVAHADTIRDMQWYLDSLRLADAHATTKGKGVKVAVIDTGIDPSQPDLEGNLLPAVGLGANNTAGRDLDGHGTSMATLIAGHGHGKNNADGILGVAPEAKIIPIAISANNKNLFIEKPQLKNELIVDAVYTALDRGADVISISVGGTGVDGMDKAVKTALDRNVLVVAAAGNDGRKYLSFPAYIPDVVAVSAIDRRNRLTNSSAYGLQVDLAAPGDDLPLAIQNGEYDTHVDGTSISAALVAGTLALIKAKYPGISANDQLEQLRWSATDVGAPGWDDKYGFGVLNPVNALSTDLAEPQLTPLTTNNQRARAMNAPTTALVWMIGLSLLGFAVGLFGLFARIAADKRI